MIHIDALYYTFLTPKKGTVLNIRGPVKSFYKWKYVFELSVIKNYLRRNKGRHHNIASAEELFKFISNYLTK